MLVDFGSDTICPPISTMELLGTAITLGSAIEHTSTCIRLLKSYYSDVINADAHLRQFKKCLDQELEVLQNLRVLCERLERHTPSHYLRVLETIFQEGSLAGRSEGFFKELEKLIAWLERQGGQRNKLVGHFGILRERTPRVPTESGETGMSLSQRLKWPMKGKKKIESFMPKLVQHRDHLILILSVIQRLAFVYQ